MDPPELLADVVCRDQQVKSLLSLLGDPHAAVPQCIFVCGDKSSGKSHTLNKVLSALNVTHAIFNCVEGYLPYLMFDSILSQLLGSSGFTSRTKCDDFMDFLAKLKTAFDEGHFHDRTVIVLEGSERLRDMNHNLLPAFMRLQELSCLKKVCVVLVSHILWDKFSPSDGLPPPIQIFFHQYSQSDIIKILSLEMPENYPADFYLNYLQLFVAVFLRTCRDVSELKYKAAENFSKYCEPVNRGEIDMHDSSKLWKHISPFFKASLQTTYMRFETGNTTEAESESIRPLEKHNSLSSSAKFALSFELPYYAKYLIIAAFLASYNSPKEDKKLFVKLSGKTKKRVPKNMKTSHAKISALVLGPRQFDLERLLAIFYSIIEEKPHISANLLTQISTLIELQLLKVGNDALEVPKYKCAVGLDFIITIARTLSFNVTKYLVDYK